MKAANEAYEELKQFLKFHTETYEPTRLAVDDPSILPVSCLAVTERKSRARAAQGLRMAINDLIEMHRHDDPRDVEALDWACKSRGVVTLSELRRRFSRDYAAVLKRGKIRNEVEHTLVQGILTDQASDVPPEEGERLEKLIALYENAAS
ncbi:MAG: hypothetical protein AB7S70_14655 [Hyphomicrobium sp.]|uniref:hypothetical protein n=1 Tax=Hyphomicrobium sp. TaxID=82 RepID=UPI003D0A03B1